MRRIAVAAGIVAMVIGCHAGNPESGSGGVAGKSEPASWAVVSDPTPHLRDYPFSLARISSEEAILVGGWEEVGGPIWIWRIEKRRLSDGALIDSFGEGGVVREVTSAYQWNGIESIRVDEPAGVFYVGGFSHAGAGHQGNVQWRIEKRYLSDGSLVSSFGIGGIVLSNPSSDWDAIEGLALDSSGGYLYAVGNDHAVGNFRWRIEKRSLEDGALDPSFGVDGVVTSDPGGDSFPSHYGVVVLDLPGESLFVVGKDGVSGGRWRVEKRSLVDGSLRGDFGTGGVIVAQYGEGGSAATSLALDLATGTLFIAGVDTILGVDKQRWRVEKRRIDDGSLVMSFGDGGILAIDPTGNSIDATPLVDLDGVRGEILLVGNASTLTFPDSTNKSTRIERRKADSGDPVGEAVHLDPLLGTWEYFMAATYDETAGALYLASWGETPNYGAAQWRLRRIAF